MKGPKSLSTPAAICPTPINKLFPEESVIKASVLGKLSPLREPLTERVPAFSFSVIEKFENMSISGVPGGVSGLAAPTWEPKSNVVLSPCEFITESLVNLTEGIAVFLLLGSDVFQVGLLQALVVIDVLSVSKFIT